MNISSAGFAVGAKKTIAEQGKLKMIAAQMRCMFRVS